MLSKHVDKCLVISYERVMKKTGRSAKVILSAEAKVLKRLRMRHGLSMRKAGERLGYSDSYISQIENGREDIPRGERLMKFLNLYGGITEKYFRQLAKEWTEEADDVDRLVDLAKKLPAPKLKTLLVLAEQMAAGMI